MITTLIIPDVHTKWQKADSIVKRYEKRGVDNIVCLGDYFDDFGDSPKLNRRTARWLKEFTAKDNHIALLGNHEFNYMYNRHIDVCSGYSSSKNFKVNMEMTSSDWNKLVPYHIDQGWYMTHAGIHAGLCTHPIKGFQRKTFEDEVEKNLRDAISMKYRGHMFRVGMARGGSCAFGGITWCDYQVEFEPIQGIKQIFGHTPGKEVRHTPIGDNCCLDTHLNHVALIEDGALRIVSV